MTVDDERVKGVKVSDAKMLVRSIMMDNNEAEM